MNIQSYYTDYIIGFKAFDFEENDKLYTKPNPKADLFEYEKYKLQKYKNNIELCKSGFHFCFSLEDLIVFKPFITNDKTFSSAVKFKPIYYIIIPKEANVQLYLPHEHNIQNGNILAVTDKLIIEQLYPYSFIVGYLGNKFYRSLKSKDAIIESEKFIYNQDSKVIKYSIVKHTNCNIVFDESFDYSKTLFTQYCHTVTIDNQSEYSQYVNRVDDQTQKIIEIPKHTTITIKRFCK